jgi:Carboxypeptidase regulatory-like domain
MGTRSVRLLAVIAALLLLLSSALVAQKVSGSVSGTVSDPQGAVIPGATVTLVDQSTGAIRTTKTNSAGTYSFPDVDSGNYTLKVSNQGFHEFIAKNVEVHVSSNSTQNAQLTVGAEGQSVEVTAAGVQLNTENGEVGNVVEGNQVRELPLNGRNFVQLTTLMPGASVSENFDNKSKGLMGGVDISFSGAPVTSNQWLVDGASNNDMGSKRTILIYPSIDGIEEFKILRNSYGPEYGGAGGAQVNIVSKGGGNQFHGTGFYFGRNAALNAKNYFIGQQNCTTANDPACQKQALERNDYGANFGGPIVKDKIFFFVSEEWNKERRGAVRHDWLPSAQERLGDFSDLAACPPPSFYPTQALKDAHSHPAVPNFPGSTTTAPGSAVLLPGSVSPAGQLYVSQTPLPTGSVCNTFDWVAQVKVPLNWREDSVRGDIKITKNNNLMLKFTNDAWTNPLHGSANGEAGLWGTQDFPAVSDAWQQPSKMAVARLTTTINSTTVNDFQFSWGANRIVIGRAGDSPDLASKVTAAMPTVYPLSGKLHSDQLPTAICWCSTFFGVQSPWANRQDLYTWKDDFSKVVGKHTFKVGMLYGRNAKDEEQGDEAGGMWGATGYQKVDWGGGTGNLYGDFLLKGETFGANENSRNVLADIRWRDYEFYGGDTWKVSPRLTLNYGVRYTLMPPEYMDKNDYSAFEPSAFIAAKGSDPCNGIVFPKGGDPSLCAKIGSTITPPVSEWRGLRPSNNHLIAPRAGFAWDVKGNSKFVLRGGIGQFFSRDPVGLTLRTKSVNPPYSAAGSGYKTLDGPLVNGVTLFDNGGGAGGWPLAGTPGQSFEQNTNVANSWQWNLTTETLLAKDTKLELGWVALRGIHLQGQADINQIKPADRLGYIQAGFVSGANRNGFFPYGASIGGNQLTQWQHRGDSIYHSLQAMFSTKPSRNSIVQASYTWSHNIADTTLSYGGTSTIFADTYNPRAGRGNADFDRRHVFNISMVYNLPSLQGHNALVKGTAGGWEIGTVYSYATGSFLTIGGLTVDHLCPSQAQLAGCNNGSVALIGVGNPWGTTNAGQFGGMPNTVKDQPCSLGKSGQWLNPQGFTANGFPLGGYPNSGTGQCAGPGLDDLDLSFNKNWQLPVRKGTLFFSEGLRLQFRLEMFNAFNHPMFRFNNTNQTFAANGCTAGDCSTGPIVGYIGPNNTVQGTTLLKGSHFGLPQFLSNLGNREIQYALKFIF